MRAVIASLLSVTSVIGCDSAIEEGTYAGYYAYGFEVMDFYPDELTEVWLVQASAPIPCIDESRTPMNSPPMVYIEIRGSTRSGRSKTSERQYARDLYVTEVVSCRNVSWDDYYNVFRRFGQNR